VNLYLNSPPVMIVAAARSGTKILRRVLAQSSDFAEFPYDINFVWKYGNYQKQHDELDGDDLTDDIRSFIINQFNKRLRKSSGKRVLEKTVSNSLRVDFLRAIFPDCKIIYLYRNGYDVAADARLCWQASALSARIQPKGDIIKKAINFPFLAGWPYLRNYFSNYAKRLVLNEQHVRSWGPRFKGIDEAIEKYSLLEVCGMQWSRSVQLSDISLSRLKESVDFICVRYEDLVTKPKEELGNIISFLDLSDYKGILAAGSANISDNYVGFAQQVLTPDDINRLTPHISQSLDLLNYQQLAI